MVEPTLVFVEVMEREEKGMPFSEEVNKACADFMHHHEQLLATPTEIKGMRREEERRRERGERGEGRGEGRGGERRGEEKEGCMEEEKR